MDWIAVSLVAVFLLAAGLSVYKISQSPTFWLGMITAVSKSAWPVIVAVITKPEDPETRAKRIEVVRKGGEWDPIRKKERERNK